jgi:hypothetical protein
VTPRAFVLAAVLGLVVQDPAPPPPCDNEAQPWMCGSVEHFCARDGERFRDDPEGRHRHTCACQHKCAPEGQNPETQQRVWDKACSTRCSPKNCRCKHPCGDT